MVHGGEAAAARQAPRFQEASRAHEGDPAGGGTQAGSSRVRVDGATANTKKAKACFFRVDWLGFLLLGNWVTIH